MVAPAPMLSSTTFFFVLYTAVTSLTCLSRADVIEFISSTRINRAFSNASTIAFNDTASAITIPPTSVLIFVLIESSEV